YTRGWLRTLGSPSLSVGAVITSGQVSPLRSMIFASRLFVGVRKPRSPGTSAAVAHCAVLSSSLPWLLISSMFVRLPVVDDWCLRTATTSSQPSLFRSPVAKSASVLLSVIAVAATPSLLGEFLNVTHCTLSCADALAHSRTVEARPARSSTPRPGARTDVNIDHSPE